jgi:acetylornithine/succinyldiaminopimelate/putrescine aminotransferase
VTDNPTRLLNQTLALTDDPDDIRFVDRDGYAVIELGHVHLMLGLSSQAALDKLAVVAAQAAANNRARLLQEVAA